jgi:hypothetical protein
MSIMITDMAYRVELRTVTPGARATSYGKPISGAPNRDQFVRVQYHRRVESSAALHGGGLFDRFHFALSSLGSHKRPSGVSQHVHHFLAVMLRGLAELPPSQFSSQMGRASPVLTVWVNLLELDA